MHIQEYINQLHSSQIDLVHNTEKILDEAETINKQFSFLNHICRESALEKAEALSEKVVRPTKYKKKDQQTSAKPLTHPLFGLTISVKDVICVKDVPSTAGSRILSNYQPLFNATAVQRLADAGAIVIGKTSQDEFGFGSFNINVGLGFSIPKNPLDERRVCGGSSGGGAGLTRKTLYPHIAVVESTGGSISCPASFCGVAGMTPTYGRVSRYGIIDYASSLDKIGLMAKDVESIALALGIISGKDENDSTSTETPIDNYYEFIKKDVRRIKIGIISETLGEGTSDYVKEAASEAVSKLESFGVETQKISLPFTSKYSLPAYYIISSAEASTNLAKFCGIRYGIQPAPGPKEGYNDFFTRVRSENFGREAKRRILLGTFTRMAGYRDAYYLRAMKVRTKIIEEYKRQLKHFDALISPTMPVIAPKLKDAEELTPLQNYMMDIMTVGPNLAGLPHMSVNIGYEKGMPIGLQIIGNHFDEKRVLHLGKALHMI